MKQKANIVHISGYSLREHPDLDVVDHKGRPLGKQYNDWEHVCWGDPSKGLLGRIPRALLEAYKTHGDRTHFVWSTGSTRERTGFNEAHYCMEIARTRIGRLRADFPEACEKELWFPRDPHEEIMVSWLETRSLLEDKSINTLTSMQELAKIIDELFPRKEVEVTLITSENHLSRVVRDAPIAIKYNDKGERVRPHVSLRYVAADTCWGGASIRDTLVDDRGDYLVKKP